MKSWPKSRMQPTNGARRLMHGSFRPLTAEEPQIHDLRRRSLQGWTAGPTERARSELHIPSRGWAV